MWDSIIHQKLQNYYFPSFKSQKSSIGVYESVDEISSWNLTVALYYEGPRDNIFKFKDQQVWNHWLQANRYSRK